MTLFFSFREPARIPVNPPNNATNTSRNVGFVLANNSLPASSIGEIRKYSAEDATAMPVATPKLTKDFRTVAASLIPTPSPKPMIGPINGEISMAPMTTAVESTFRPMLAITIENTKIQTLNPRNSMSFLMPSMVASDSARSRICKRSMTSGRRMAKMRFQGAGLVEVVMNNGGNFKKPRVTHHSGPIPKSIQIHQRINLIERSKSAAIRFQFAQHTCR